ncbi:MAG: hypothetical protein D6775_12375, partial [Caldilineae bacterium]
TTTGATHPPAGVPGFLWEVVADADKYHIQLSTSPAFSTVFDEKDTVATAYTPTKAMADGDWYWRVRAHSDGGWGPYSQPFHFVKDWSDGGNIIPRPLQPAEDAVLQDFGDGFTWEPVPGAASYLFEIDDDPAFGSVNYSDKTLAPAHTPRQRLGNSVYYWRVTPIDYRNNYGQPSPARRFEMAWNEAPTLLGPDDNVVTPFLPAFHWTAIKGAAFYEVDLSTSPNFIDTETYKTHNTSYTPNLPLTNDAEYYWRVRAIDANNNSGADSEARSFRMAWNYAPTLLSPTDNYFSLSNPLFLWTPVPGAEQYELWIDESNTFALPVKIKVKTHATRSYVSSWGQFAFPGTYYWRVRALDSGNNAGPWSATYSFRLNNRTGAQPIYPHPYYPPHDDITPVYEDVRAPFPLFIWDVALDEAVPQPPFVEADYYVLEVDDHPAFLSPNFRVETAGLGAVPTLSQPFANFERDRTYYWRVTAYLNGAQLGTPMTWPVRFKPESVLADAATAEIRPWGPPEGFQAMEFPPPLSWSPVQNADHYQVQVATDPDFGQIVEEAQPLFPAYVPGQQSKLRWQNRTYFWRVRVPPDGPWSPTRRFHLNHRIQMGNPEDYQLPIPLRIDPLNVIADDPAEGGGGDLTRLAVALDRYHDITALNWYLETDLADLNGTYVHVFLVDVDHEPESGATTDPYDQGWPGFDNPDHRPDTLIEIARQGTQISSALLWRWQNGSWQVPQNILDIGGAVIITSAPPSFTVRLPFTALGTGAADWPGSIGVHAYTLNTDFNLLDAIPDDGRAGADYALAADLVTPAFPFDTTSDNPFTFYSLPELRWHLPTWTSVDGYSVEIATDVKFTEIVETWSVYEGLFPSSPIYSWLSTSFVPTHVLPDNESYYWRVRLRHEKYTTNVNHFDYGPFSHPMRFRLSSVAPTGLVSTPPSPTPGSPTLSWDRVDGVGAYRLQIDDDINFSSPLLNVTVYSNEYTPTDNLAATAIVDGTWYWRVAIVRENVLGRWSEVKSFVRQTPKPSPVSPANDGQVDRIPTFTWEPVLEPPNEPVVSAPRYRLQADTDPNFGSPLQVDVDGTSYTPNHQKTFPDGTWYWRVAMITGNTRVGPYSEQRRFQKTYPVPQLALPPGLVVVGSPTFRWQPVSGAAYYELEYDDNEFFGSPVERVKTDNASYTPTRKLNPGIYYWRVRIADARFQTGPFAESYLQIGFRTYLPWQQRP